MTRKYLESLDQEGGDTVEDGEYTFEVVDARALEDKPHVWIDMKIEGGPDDGRVVTVGLNIPDDTASRGAIFHFKKKMRAFSRAVIDGGVFNLPDEEQPAKIAELIIGVRGDAVLSTQKEGAYKGTQQLDETSPLAETAPAPAAQTKIVTPTTPPAQVQPQPAVVEAAEEPVSVPDSGPSDEDELPF